MQIPFTGGCACGRIRYECSAPARRMVNCHCRDCQLASGSAYSPTVVMARDAVRVTRGGTPLFASSSASPQHLGVRAASLDDSSWYKAEADVWTGSAQAWDCMDAAVPKFEKGRPRP